MTAVVPRTVIVGASVGGVRTAQALRAEGYDGEILLVDRDAELPYDKPPLSKGLLSGKSELAAIRLLTAEKAADLGVELRLGVAVTSLDSLARRVELADGSTESYDHLVIATGATADPGPWGRREGIHVIRTFADTAALRADLDLGGPVVVIGSGFVGAEVAATTRELGHEVHLVDLAATPMGRGFEADVGQRFAALHEDRGVHCHFGVGVDAVEGTRGDLTVHLTDGTALAAGVVVVGIGARSNTGWLDGSGLKVDDGVVTDEFLRARGVEGVFAVGDVCRWFDPPSGRYVRVEHWTNAVDQAVCVAHNVVAPDDLRSYACAEYVWTDQYDWKAQVVGRHAGAVVREEVAGGRGFAVLYGDADGTLMGAAVVNWPKALVATRKALASRMSFAEVADRLRPAPATDGAGA
ncbi:NAD(P)/FAD-dependent oxidoreductase [Nocardioides sp. NPDC058538]|uniref:NAD(P)/FAD-dependent oxidoreductase n=1 Tax=Nocardioides sp. NPDC058538 TaxID=3346542 RepID=UPI0036688416